VSSTWVVRDTGVVRQVLRAMVLALLALLLVAMLLTLTSQRVAPALQALWRGAFGSWYAFGSVTLIRMVPLALTGLAVSIAFRAGILNIGAEGQLLVGAAAATAVAGAWTGMLGWWVMPATLVMGSLSGALWAGIAAWLRQQFGVLEVISTIMLNFVALNGVGYLVRGPLQEPARVNPQSYPLPVPARLPVVVPGSRLHLGFVLTLLLACGMWWWLRNTAGGFRLRAVGANASAARSAGQVNVAWTTALAFLVSGALAGLAGATEVTGVTYALYENLSPGYGFTAIAVALMARLHPLGVLATALFFGALEAGANAMQRDAGVPVALVRVVEALLILLVVAADGWRAREQNVLEAGA
jgi:ABC-type uncharacterized transport system permease subunit